MASIVVGAALLVVGSYALTPRWTISKLSDWETNPQDLSEHYDRLRAAFERQMLPQVEDYPPPIAKDVVLDALSDPRAVRLFVTEPLVNGNSQLPPDCRQGLRQVTLRAETA